MAAATGSGLKWNYGRSAVTRSGAIAFDLPTNETAFRWCAPPEMPVRPQAGFTVAGRQFVAGMLKKKTTVE